MKHELLFTEIKIEVTHRCSLACIHCSSDASPSSDREMSRQDCLRVLNEAAGQGARRVAISGGEPLLWDGLEEIISWAIRCDMEATVYTAGNVPEIDDRLRKLADIGLGTIIFSMFGSSAATHEAITRKAGSFNASAMAIKNAVSIGLTVEIHFVPMAINFEELAEIAEQVTEWGVSRISVLRLVPQGRGSLLAAEILTGVQNIQLKGEIERLRTKGYEIRTGSPLNFLLLNEQPRCSAGIDRLIVAPDLRIYPCDAFKRIAAEDLVGSLSCSTLRGTSLAKCWKESPYLNAVREHLSAPYIDPCASCEVLDRCLSGCLAQKVVVEGHLAKVPDPMCVYSHGAKNNDTG